MTSPSREPRKGLDRAIWRWLWAAALLLCALLLAAKIVPQSPWRGAIDTRITAMLPQQERSPLAARAESLDDTANRLVILVGADDASAAARKQRDAAAQALRQALAPIARLDDGKSLESLRLPAEVQPALIATSLAGLSDDDWQARALRQLFQPGGQRDLIRDPFGLAGAWQSWLTPANLSLSGGQLLLRAPTSSADQPGNGYRLISATLIGSAYAMSDQQALAQAVNGVKADYPDVQLLRSGLVFHASNGARQAKQEMSTIGLGSLIGVLLLLWAVFRTPRRLPLLLVPVATGVLFALPLTWWAFGSLHVLTLAFGASLIGISIDYVLHLECMRRLTTNGRGGLAALWPGLTLGLCSSLAAYLAITLTPMPGLRQMGMFAALGLIGAWLSVRLWLPQLPLPAQATRVDSPAARAAGCLARAIPGKRSWQALGLLLLAALASLYGLRSDDRLTQLNPSPASLINEQREVQRLLAEPDGLRYLIVQAETDAALLTRLHALEGTFQQLNARQQLGHWASLAQQLPTLEQQQANLGAMRERTRTLLPQVLSTAGLPPELVKPAEQAIADAHPLRPADWVALPAGEMGQRLWLDSRSAAIGIVRFGDVTTEGGEALARLAADDDSLEYVDQVARLSTTLGRIRSEMAWLVGGAVVLISLLLALRYRRSTWRALLPPLGGLVLTLAALTLAGVGLNLFHLLGLLLVLGIGLDAGIFCAEHPARSADKGNPTRSANEKAEQGKAQTSASRASQASLLAISLSCASSLLAFGLLSFSQTPALAALGLACLLGLSATWCLVPFARS
ncbi:MMPL family transporter [Cobetia amphilecti]|uniref:MMPL family transporter n=1 Tax=Cobetia amphilecti TaxID=1055104 RepID=UPI00069423C4|nr:MFS transporter [Cobetia amphilecti]